MNARPGRWLAVILVVFAITAAAASWNSSATADEPIYLAAGVRILETGDLSTNRISSPYLLKPWLALPSFLSGERLPEADQRMSTERLAMHWLSAWEFLHGPGRSAMVRLRLARVMNVILAMATVVLLYRLGRHLGDARLGLAAAFLYAAWPEVLAHAGLAGLDTGLTFLVLATLSVVLPVASGASTHPGRLLAGGLLLGLTFLAKSAAVVLGLYLGLVMCWQFVRGCGRAHRHRWPVGGRLLVVLILGLVTIHAGFGFQGTGERLSAHARYSEIQQKLEAWPAPLDAVALWSTRTLPSPLPGPYVDLLLVQAGLGAHGKEVFFHGERRRGGWAWFLPAALTLKTPTLHLLLLLAGLVVVLCTRCWRGEWGLLWGFAGFALGFLSLTDRYGLVRYVLPVLPVLALLAALPVAVLCTAAAARRRAWQRSARALVTAVVLVPVGSLVAAFPWYLSFLNEALGGPWQCHEWMVDSNSDWGQDLARAAQYAKEQGHEPIALGYFGSGRARDFDLDATLLPSVGHEPAAGEPWWFARGTPETLPAVLPDRPLYVSTTLLQGLFLDDPYAALRARGPDAMATPSVAVFLPPHRPAKPGPPGR